MATQQLVWRLHGLRVLRPCEIRHAGQRLEIYRIDTDSLVMLLRDSDELQDLRLLAMAMEIERSQAGIERRACARHFAASL